MAEGTELPDELKEEVAKIRDTTKKGFDLKARLENRGLRKASITLYLDDEKGLELGWAEDTTNGLGAVVGREQVGVIGELDALAIERDAIITMRTIDNAARESFKTDAAWQKHLDAPTPLDGKIAELEAKRDRLVEELTSTAIVVNMRAVPPVIQKDCARLARATLKITDKGIPDDRADEFTIAQTGHLMSVMFQSVTDNATGEVNLTTSYEDAMALMDFLPPGQFWRLDKMMGQVQFTDAISRNIEGQEDFS